MNVVAFAPVAGHHIIAWLVIGLVAGLLASLVVRGGGMGFFRDIIVGLVGAVVGGVILHAVRNGGANTTVKLWQEIVVAFIGAVILLFVIKAVSHRGAGSRGR